MKRLARLTLIAIGCALYFHAAPAHAGPDQEQIACLAVTVYHEARGEGAKGMRAVAAVVMNRVKSSLFPDTVCDVVRQHAQFSWFKGQMTAGRKIDAVALQKSYDIARAFYMGTMKDNTGGALWYHAVTVTPAWSDDYTRVVQIGQHVFYKKGSPT